VNAFFQKLEDAAKKNNSRLCVGLDPRVNNMPEPFRREKDPIFAFNKAVIDAVLPYMCAFKPNLAFYEAAGPEGLAALKKTREYIPRDIPVIADAKRGDIGSTAEAYAQAIFDYYRFDAVTLNPLLGKDSIAPFLKYEDRGLFILCLTSNAGSKDFQIPNKLYLSIVEKVKEWNKAGNCGLVVGATKPEYLKEIRILAPDLCFLIPGIGAQGGDLEKTLEYAPDQTGGGYIINVSRGITEPPGEGEFQKRAADAAEQYKNSINSQKEIKP